MVVSRPVVSPNRPSTAESTGGALRRILIFLSVVAGLCLLAYLGVAAWSPNEFTQPEAIVAIQSRMLAQTGTLYYDLKSYPYTVCAYMPVMYALIAGMLKAGVPVLVASRGLSVAAMFGLLWLVWKILMLYTGERQCAWMGVVLAAATPLTMIWGTIGRVDMPAIFLTFAAFYQFARYRVTGGDGKLWWAGLLAMAALFTKQTAVAAPAAIFLALLPGSPRKALKFAALVAGCGGLLVLASDAALGGRLLGNTVFANLNPFAAYKLKQQFSYFFVVFSPLLVLIALGFRQALRCGFGDCHLYLGLSVALFGLTSGKVGSDSNYQIESAILLVVAACLSLHSLRFFSLYRSDRKSWITLLVLPAILYVVQGVRIAGFALADRISTQKSLTRQLSELRPYLAAGRVFTVDTNSLMRTGRPIEVEPLIYRLLVEAGRIDDSEVRRDLESGAFAAALLYEDLAEPPPENPEMDGPTLGDREVLARRYRFVARIEGKSPIYVYRPRLAEAP